MKRTDGVWITTVPAEEVRARAAAVPAGLPLAGLTFAVKDNIDVAGMPTTAACPDFAYVPERTAPVVQRLLDAGAVLVGKTNLDQFATGLTGARSPYGSPRERLRRRADLRRVQLRVGGRGRRRAGRLRARHRHRRLRPGARGVERHRRRQADPGAAQHARRRAGLPFAGLRLGLRPDVAQGHRRVPGSPAARNPRIRGAATGPTSARGRRPRIGVAGALDFFGDAGPGEGVRRRAGPLRRASPPSTSDRC